MLSFFGAIMRKDFFGVCDIFPLVWWRYLDEIFMLCQHGEREPKKFLEILNFYDHTIKFTAIYSREKMHFLRC